MKIEIKKIFYVENVGMENGENLLGNSKDENQLLLATKSVLDETLLLPEQNTSKVLNQSFFWNIRDACFGDRKTLRENSNFKYISFQVRMIC